MSKRNKIVLGVNIDHVATLRELRGGTTLYPDVLKAAEWSIQGGAEQITIHVREDRRHMQEQDLASLSRHLTQELFKVPLNLEMAADPKMVKMALKYRPDWCCFVPEKREELTTEGGLDVGRSSQKIKSMVAKLHFIGIECSMFIDPSLQQVRHSFDVGADAIEFHTGHWVLLKGRKKETEWRRLVKAAKLAHRLGLRVHAGHGLDFEHARIIKKLPHLHEVNIGHSLVCYALESGLKKAVQKMKKELQ
jgi:pyridoxine 5-phosphate synthase